MSKQILAFSMFFAAVVSTEAGQRNCCPATCAPIGCTKVKSCAPLAVSTTSCAPVGCPTTISRSHGPTTKYFKAKDGTIREVMTHWAALHRAVEADHLDEKLATAETELEATRARLAELQQQSASQLAEMQTQLDALKNQLSEQTKVA